MVTPFVIKEQQQSIIISSIIDESQGIIWFVIGTENLGISNFSSLQW